MNCYARPSKAMLRRPVESGLAALIGVVDHAMRLAREQRHVQRRDHEIGCLPLAEGPSDNLAAEDIEHHGQIAQACPGGDVGHVGHLQRVDATGLKAPLHQIRGRAADPCRAWSSRTSPGGD